MNQQRPKEAKRFTTEFAERTEQECGVDWHGQLILRWRTVAMPRTSSVSVANSLGMMDWTPSERAFSGSWWTSTRRPSAPTATAASEKGRTLWRLPVPCEGSTMIGKWLRRLTAGTTARSNVLREKSEKVRTPRSQSAT